MRYLITGAAGFIGFHTASALLNQGAEVLGFDSVNDYYDPYFKEIRLNQLRNYKNFTFVKGFLEDQQLLEKAWTAFEPQKVIHLAAQAGVRYSIENPMAYINSNIIGFQNAIELARKTKPNQFVYASSSSVYGSNKELPFSENQQTASPISLYAATKLSNELVAKTYHHLYELPSVGLRFFTVYGPFGRPDMALFKFTEAIIKGESIDLYNYGNMHRDFTFVSDIVDGILAAADLQSQSTILNLGKGNPESLLHFVNLIEECVGKEAKKNLLPMQMGDVPYTHSSIEKAKTLLNYQPKVTIAEGVPKFVDWFKKTATERKNSV